MRIGIIARSDNTGLGNQTLELTKLLNPDKVLLINSTSFNGNKQYPERYDGYDVWESPGFPTNAVARHFLKDLDIVLSCETFYNPDFIFLAKKMHVKTVLQYNYELFANMSDSSLLLPDILISPSTWYLQDVERIFGSSECRVVHLPPPTTGDIFDEAKKENLSSDHKRILHIAGRVAANDRNGTDTVIKMLKHSRSDYELVIRVQHEIARPTKDSRLIVEVGNPENREDLYKGFDAMVLPRRYGGLCLPMNEALLSGLPVFMSDLSPNNNILPQEWLFDTRQIGSFLSKAAVDLYEAVPESIAKTIDDYVNMKDKTSMKNQAIEIGNTFSAKDLSPKYMELFNNIL
jgi:glycosyltransferase involved in cell wall biosynthesis